MTTRRAKKTSAAKATTAKTTTTTTKTSSSSSVAVLSAPSADWEMGVTFCWAKWVDMNPHPTKIADISFSGRRRVSADGVEKLRNSFADCCHLKGRDRYSKKLLSKGVHLHTFLLLHRTGGKIVCKDGNHRLRAMVEWTYAFVFFCVFCVFICIPASFLGFLVLVCTSLFFDCLLACLLSLVVSSVPLFVGPCQ